MKFLCLHGSGTNADIFAAQTAAIRHELGGGHTYEFVQGNVPWPLASGLESMASPDDSYWSVWDWDSYDSHMKALDDLENYLVHEGPFDGVLGFSSGASLGAMHLIRQNMRNPDDPPSFRCAVFLNCTGAYDPIRYVEKGEVLKMSPKDFGEIIKIPVANIWGVQDERRSDCEMVSDLCQASTKSVFVHEGGHAIPGLTNEAAILPCVRAIQRVITQAISEV